MKKKQLLIISVIVVVIAIVLLLLVSVAKKNQQRIQSLFTMKPQDIQIFRLYPKAGRPFGTPINFAIPDPLIEDFFQALSDHQSYPISRDTVEQEEHSWLLEVADHKILLQLSCYIPHKKGEIVVVEFGDFSETGSSYYGDFQSHLLYQWYQKHSHRWLPSQETEHQ